MRFAPLLFSLILLLVVACSPDAEEQQPAAPEDLDDRYTTFWQNLTVHCDDAFEGEVLAKPEGDDQLSEDAELVVHFRECGEDEVRLPLHVREPGDDEWNRSRTWVITPHENGLELRHDHRNPDGTEEENTWYGATTLGDSDVNQAEFISSGRDGEGLQSGWRIQIEPNERYTYGTIRDGDWRYHLEFDLTNPIDPPPAPWGFEE